MHTADSGSYVRLICIEPGYQSISNDGLQLSYLCVPSAILLKARLVILHGYGDHAGRYLHFMQWMSDRGVACYACDFRGHGRSKGRHGYVRRWDDYLIDLSAFLAIEPLASKDAPLFVLGHSHGGLIATAAAQRGLLDDCQGVILSSPYFELQMPVSPIKRWLAAVLSYLYPAVTLRSGLDPAMVTRDLAMQADTRADIFCRGIATPRWFFESLKAQLQIRAAANQFHHPLLMLIPGSDSIADAKTSITFFDQCKSIDKTLEHYPEHRHELLRELGRELIFKNILNWICR